MTQRPKAQGDLFVAPVIFNLENLLSGGYCKPVDLGSIEGLGKVLHIGEARNHFHCIDGDVDIYEATEPAAFLGSDAAGLKLWIVNVKSKEATMKHGDAGGVATEDHAPIKLGQGMHRVTTQRQADPTTTPARVID